MDRREALVRTTLLLGGTIIGSQVWLSGCTRTKGKADLLSADDVLFLDEVGETILPKTDRSPGAKEAHIGEFMKTMVTDCYDESEQKIFTEGVQKINDRASDKFYRAFMQLSADEKATLIIEIDAEARKQVDTNKTPHYFTLMKQLTLWGYFSSEIGCTQALRYNPVPGRYEGCVQYHEGEKAWA